MVGLDASGQALTQTSGEGPCLLVSSAVVRSDDDRTQVAKVETVDLGHRGLGPIAPLSGLKSGVELLGDRDDLFGVGVAFGCGPYRRQAAFQQLICDRPVFFWYLGDRRVAVHPARLEPGRPGFPLTFGFAFGPRALLVTPWPFLCRRPVVSDRPDPDRAYGHRDLVPCGHAPR